MLILFASVAIAGPNLNPVWVDSVGDEVWVAVTNNGTTSSRGFWVDFFLDLPAAPVVGDLSPYYGWVPGLDAGSSTIVVIQIPGSSSWSGWWDVSLDSTGIIPELREYDNIGSKYNCCQYIYATQYELP
ncbi:MAG: hypothetical protein ABMA64_17125 [Myxococcota bacterium]